MGKRPTDIWDIRLESAGVSPVAEKRYARSSVTENWAMPEEEGKLRSLKLRSLKLRSFNKEALER